MHELTNLILKKFNLDGNTILKKKIRGLQGITGYQLIDSLITTTSIKEAAAVLGYTDNPVKQAIREFLLPHFPERKHAFGESTKRSWQIDLLYCIRYAICRKCNYFYKIEEMSKNSSDSRGHESYCKKCWVGICALDKQRIKLRTPLWTQTDRILEFYSACPIGYEVDHIIPLQGTNVSGLHVIENLQYLLKSENRQKRNKFEIM